MPTNKSKRGSNLYKINDDRRGKKRSEPMSDDGDGSDFSAAEESGSNEDEVINEESVPREEEVEKRRRQERYWGAGKKYARRHCGYSLSALRSCVPIALSQTVEELPEELRDEQKHPDLPVSPLYKQRRWARISRQYMAEYRKGESGDAVVRAVNAQRSKRHRDTGDPRARRAEAAMEAKSFGQASA